MFARTSAVVLFVSVCTLWSVCRAPAQDKWPMENRLQAVLGLTFELLPDGQGMKVMTVRPGSPATRLASATRPNVIGSLDPGDVIVAIDGKTFRSLREWYDLLNEVHRLNKGKVRLSVRDVTTGNRMDWIATPEVAKIDVPLAANNPVPPPSLSAARPETSKIDRPPTANSASVSIRVPRITPVEDPKLPDLFAAELDVSDTLLNTTWRRTPRDTEMRGAGYGEVTFERRPDGLYYVDQFFASDGGRLSNSDWGTYTAIKSGNETVVTLSSKKGLRKELYVWNGNEMTSKDGTSVMKRKRGSSD